MESASDKYNIIKRVTMISIISNVLLTASKFVIGILGHSSAMVADAAHSLSDCLTNVAIMISLKISNKPKDDSHHYGHGKVETLAAAFTGLVLIITAILIFYEGVNKVLSYYHGEILETPSNLTFIMAIFSVVLKEWMYKYTYAKNKDIQSNALSVVALDHRSDAFFSIGTVLGVGGAIFLGSKWVVLDPLTAVIFSLLIVKMGGSITYKSLNELMEASLDSKTHKCIEDTIASTEGVLGYHELKTRKIGNDVALDVHIEVDNKLTIVQAHDIATTVEFRLQEMCGYNGQFSIHAEPNPDPDTL
jgi:cation diffusion facilitator family transporter